MTGFDVGGSHKSQQLGYESFGIRGQNRVVNEGVDTTEGQAAAGWYPDYFVNDQITVSAAGADVEMNTPGSHVVQVTKSGANEFKGLEHLSYEPGRFVGNNIDQRTKARGFTGQPNLIFWEGHADLGGPVKRDRAWFFAAYNHFKIDKAISGVARDVATDLGIFDDVTYEEWSVILDPGDILVFHSDGLSEAPDPQGCQFGVPRLSNLIEAHAGLSAGELADRLLGEVQEFTRGAPLQDDRTLLVMKVR